MKHDEYRIGICTAPGYHPNIANAVGVINARLDEGKTVILIPAKNEKGLRGYEMNMVIIEEATAKVKL